MDHRFLLLPVAALAAASPMARATDYLSVEQAQNLMFPGVPLRPADVTLSKDEVKAIENDAGVEVLSPHLKIWRTPGGDWFIADEVLGKHEFITFALGLDATGGVKDVEVLQYNESYGDQIRNPAWRAQFSGMHHGATLRLGDDIKNISSATLSCKHITEGVKRLLSTYALVLSKQND